MKKPQLTRVELTEAEKALIRGEAIPQTGYVLFWWGMSQQNLEKALLQ